MYGSVLLITFALLCNHHHSPSPEFSITPNRNITYYPPSPQNPRHHCSSFSLWIIGVSHSGIKNYLSFCDWLISFSLMSSEFILVVVYIRILNVRSKTRDQICILMDTSQARYHWATTGTSKDRSFYKITVLFLISKTMKGMEPL